MAFRIKPSEWNDTQLAHHLEEAEEALQQFQSNAWRMRRAVIMEAVHRLKSGQRRS